MSVNPVARVYAEALFGIARDRSRVEEILQELEGFLEIVRDNREIELFLSSPVLDPSEKITPLTKAMEGRFTESVIDFLCLLVQKRRIEDLPRIVEGYRSLADEHAGRSRISVRTATPLPDSLRKEFDDALRSALERTILVEAEIDPTLTGGAVVSIGDTVYDGSIRGRLNRFRKQIMRSAGYENKG
jgi:F-type H+-transporting ATPase subunit delta